MARSNEIMFTELGVQMGEAVYQPGDLTGLKVLGKDSGCLPTPAPPPAK